MMKVFLQQARSQLQPRFNELIAFQIAFLCVISWFAFPELREAYGIAWLEAGNLLIWTIAFNIILLSGIVLSTWNVFVRRKKSMIEKYLMGVFIMVINGVAGIAAGVEIFPMRWSIMVIYPVWNVIIGIFLIYEAGIVEVIITDEDASWLEIIITTAISLITFFIARYASHAAWGITLSVCIFYSSLFAIGIPWIMNRLGRHGKTKVKRR